MASSCWEQYDEQLLQTLQSLRFGASLHIRFQNVKSTNTISGRRPEEYDVYDDDMNPESRPLLVSDLVSGTVSTSHLYEHSTDFCDR